MGFLFYLEIMIAIGALLYIGWIFYPYYKSRNDENISWKLLVNNHKKQLSYGIVPILLVITVYLTIGPVRYTNNVYLWQWQHNQISTLISKEHSIVNALKNSKNKIKDEKAYADYVNYISKPVRQIRDNNDAADLQHLSGTSLEIEESVQDLVNEVVNQNEEKEKLFFLREGKISKKENNNYIKSLKDKATEASAITFLEFMDVKTYLDNKDKLDKIVQSKMI